jgi:peptide-methionine (S)-S-oxide reductase
MIDERSPLMRHARLIVILALLGFVPAVSESAAAKGAHKKMEKTEAQKATFAAGCFWGVEAAFRQIKGVLSTQVGYTGGRTTDPSYEDVCSEKTGHAEAVEVTYNPVMVKYDVLLNVFWQNHDPTTPNRQGPDVGEQYRSAIFFHSPAQETAAKASKARLEAERRYKRPIVTQIVEAGAFYRAEEYHQQYLENRGLSVCHMK